MNKKMPVAVTDGAQEKGEKRKGGKTHTNSIGMEFILIPAGSFLMGTDKSVDNKAFDDETPQHRVTISTPFYLSKYAVTNAQWEALMGSKPSKFEGQNNPVEQVSWNDAQDFIKKMNQKEGGAKYRLPTEAEREYACRAGTSTIYSFGNDAGKLEKYAWYMDNSDGSTHPVGQKKPNPWGLYDMHGNVWEWVCDWKGAYPTSAPANDPSGPSAGVLKVLRGGSWLYGAGSCRSAYRYDHYPDHKDSNIGFRLAMEIIL
jgi:formylglycine-generating enzyme required for sulfatase activity